MRRRRRFSIFAPLALACAPSLTAQTPAKKLIEFGWDRPSPAFISTHLATMEASPFDGVVLQYATGPRIFRLAQVDTVALNRDAALLRATTFRRLTDNFALMGLTPDTGWDWFDDRAWAFSEDNARRYARAARIGGLRGIALDYEPYGPSPWNFNKLPHGPGRTFGDYAKQVQARGRQFMTALQAEYPDLTILTFFQMSYLDVVASQPSAPQRATSLPQNDFGLLPAFVTGMLEVATGRTRIIDGNERSYWYADSTAFLQGAQMVKNGALVLLPSQIQAAYRARVTVGQTIFVDYLLGIFQRKRDATAARVAPDRRMNWLEYNLYQALRHSDEYAWVYSQKLNWWDPASLPPGLMDAVNRATKAASTGAPLGIGPDDFIH